MRLLSTRQKTGEGLKLIGWYGVKELEELLLKEIEGELKLKGPDDQLSFDLYLGGSEFHGQAYFNIESAKSAESWQILSPVNPNGYGTKELNRFIQKTFRKNTFDLALDPPPLWKNNDFAPKRIPKPVGDDNMVYGDKVINLRNTRWNKSWNEVYPKEMKEKSLQYFANGEIGLLTGEYRTRKFFESHFEAKKQGKHVSLGDPKIRITFSSQQGYSYVFYPWHFSEESDIRFELAYAITVHKSQGSGFDKVFLVLPNPCGILSREMFYTALTRQQAKIIIFHQGDFKDFKKYISDGWSETGRRMTDLFGLPKLRIIKEKYYDSNHVQISADGQFMISKSEVIIADHLFYNKIRYTYENPVTDDRGITIKPDFTIEARDLGITFYWEHLGLLTDDEYRRKWNLKLEWYKNYGIKLYEEATAEDDKILITTRR